MTRPRQRVLARRRRRLVGAGLGLMALGILAVPTPLPVGFLLFLLGLVLVARGSPWAQKGLVLLRRWLPPLSHALNRVTPRLPSRIRGFVARSDPALSVTPPARADGSGHKPP